MTTHTFTDETGYTPNINSEGGELWIKSSSGMKSFYLRPEDRPAVATPTPAMLDAGAKALEEHSLFGDPDEGSVCECGKPLAPAGVYAMPAWQRHLAAVVWAAMVAAAGDAA